MLRPLYDWAMRMAAGRHPLTAIAGTAVLEATFPFVPPDVILGPMVLARRDRAWFYAAVCTVCSVLGGCIGYAFGYFASDWAVGLLSMTGRAGALHDFQATFARIGLMVILIKGVVPIIPYMLVTLASGLAHFSLPVFIAASFVIRGGRFFLVAALLQHPHAKAFVDRYLTWLVLGVLVLLALALVAVHFLEKHAG
jgi:membrane protein YqaA with SNARE-associated domain